MDKYQKALLKTSCAYIGFSVQGHLKSSGIYEDEKIILKQDPDITINDYTLYISNISVEAVFAIKGASKIPFTAQADPTYRETRTRFYLPVNFDDKIDSVLIEFKNNLADALRIPVVYEEADKQSYYAQKEQERKDALLAAAAIKCSTGADLINIYFQPCCSDYEYTEIYLYIPKDYVTVGGPYGPVKKPSSWQLFKKCKVPSEDFYKSINGLAYGTYAYVIKQFDKKDNLLLETEYIEFSLKAPKQPIMGRINRI